MPPVHNEWWEPEGRKRHFGWNRYTLQMNHEKKPVFTAEDVILTLFCELDDEGENEISRIHCQWGVAS